MSLEAQAKPDSAATLPQHNPPRSDRRRYRILHRILGKNRPWVSWRKSARAIFFVSCKLFAVSDSALHPYRSRHRHGAHVNTHSISFSSCRAEYLSRLPSHRMGIPLRRMVSWANLCTYVFIILFFLVVFLHGLTKRAFSKLHDHHSTRKALRLGRRATRDVLRTGSWGLDHSHVEQVCPTYQHIT